MAELVFVATIIFVAYVVFVVLGGDKKDTSEPVKAPEVKAPVVEPEAKKTEQSVPVPASVAVKTAPASNVVKSAAKSRSKASAAKTVAAKVTPPAAPAPAPAPAPAATVDSLKNPKTGEVAKVPNSYAFAKRWIKDALVEEGLLDKVYKNNELDDATGAKIQAALQQLKAMAKYQ